MNFEKKQIKYIAAIAAVFLFANCKARETIRVSGSETMNSMLEITAGDYRTTQSNYKVEVFGGGSSVGMRELIQNKTHAALTSREPTPVESENLHRINNWEKQILAYDGLTLVVHPDNVLTKVTLKQLRDLFAGKIRNFKEIGGSDVEVLPVIRNEKSGSLAFFMNYVFRQSISENPLEDENLGLDLAANALITGSNEELIETVKTKKGAISFLGMGVALTEAKTDVKVLQYARTESDEFHLPTAKSVYERKYTLSRPLYFVYFNNSQNANDFASYLLSERGQNRIQAAGYLRATVPEIEVRETR